MNVLALLSKDKYQFQFFSFPIVGDIKVQEANIFLNAFVYIKLVAYINLQFYKINL